jgi:ribonucleoside-diphosphate reductase alpha chain/ribonucleoside-triphosphate reductase
VQEYKAFSNLAAVVTKRTYARRKADGTLETWPETVERAIRGNTEGYGVSAEEIERLRYFLLNRKAGPAGRGWWFSGAAAQKTLGGVALNNCWAVAGDNWMNYVMAQDLLMLGGGVGLSVEHRFVSKLPKIKKGVVVTHKATKDANFIVPDSREGWCELTRRTLEAFFVTGKGFTYSTICIRGAGEPINGFGGVASGPLPLIAFIEKLCGVLSAREGRAVRPIDAADVMCTIGEMVVAGNVRRSAIIIIGDAWDREYLKAKRFDLGPIPTWRAQANFSVAADDEEDLTPSFWKTYEAGEPYGIVNRANIQKFARMGELKKDSAFLMNPCAEACLEDGEPCNLQEIALPNLDSEEEFIEAARLMHRWGKRVTMENYHWEKSDEVVKRNRRVGTGITGCLRSPLFNAEVLDRAYAAIQDENRRYSKELGIPESIRTTVVKPSGTMSKVFDMAGYEGIHAAYSRYYIQRVRFASTDPLVEKLREAGHHIEPVVRFDGTLDHSTVVVDFYEQAPDGYPVADEDWDTWKQLDAYLMAQRHWADQAVSVTVYYRREDIARLKTWVAENLSRIKSISFLCHSEHGFKQAPKEAISKEQYEKLSARIRPLKLDDVDAGEMPDTGECQNGACPIR